MFDFTNNDFKVTNNKTIDLETTKKLFNEIKNLEEKIVEEFSDIVVKTILNILVEKLAQAPTTCMKYKLKMDDLAKHINTQYKTFRLTRDAYEKILHRAKDKLEEKGFDASVYNCETKAQELTIVGWS